ncbi:MAG: DinB family protein [bacterium]|nr:DinB family protein [bacterium]
MDILTWRPILWQQFGAAIEMLENAVSECPEELWVDDSKKNPVWYLAFHTLFWLDLYLTGQVEGFCPPSPFTLAELDPEGEPPERPYTRAELQSYLEHCRMKCYKTIETLTEEEARRRCSFGWGEVSFAELLLYNLRHVQHGTAQLNLHLRQTIDSVPAWVARTKADAKTP